MINCVLHGNMPPKTITRTDRGLDMSSTRQDYEAFRNGDFSSLAEFGTYKETVYERFFLGIFHMPNFDPTEDSGMKYKTADALAFLETDNFSNRSELAELCSKSLDGINCYLQNAPEGHLGRICTCYAYLTADLVTFYNINYTPFRLIHE